MSVLFTLSTDIFAAQELIFTEKLKPTAKVSLTDFLNENNLGLENQLYAEHDINNDGYPEFFIKSKHCEKDTNLCEHYILAKSKDKNILLLNLKAKKIAISDTKTNGIHDILAIRDKKNDYRYERFIWSPSDKQFKPAMADIEGK